MISQQEYLQRRQQLAAKLPPNCVAIIPAGTELLRNGDSHYRFRQASDFYYLTGFNEPDALLLISSEKTPQSILFNRPRNPSEEQWTGPRLGQDGALKQLGMNQAFSIDNLSVELPKLLTGKAVIYYAIGRYPELEETIITAFNTIKKEVRRGVPAPAGFVDLDPIIGEMRLIKSNSEIDLMRKAAAISVNAHKAAMKRCKYSEYEYELEAELCYEFTRQGCRSVAYDPIVGAGENACVLHYTDNNGPLKQGDLVLIDAGGEYGNYAADITRTFPVSGRFTPEQKSIYELVLKSQKAGIAAIKPGLAWNAVQQIIVKVLTEGLCELDILKGKVEDLIKDEAYKPFYMHNSGHWLGLDVHDAGAYKINQEWRPLEAGMVLTVEPGLYISEQLTGVDKRWLGIGIRIEDDVLVTATGSEVLTGGLPVDVDEIEALMRD